MAEVVPIDARTRDRKLPNFLDGFEEFASRSFNTTARFAKWTGIWLLATSVFRSVGMKTGANETFPNFYVQLVGGPGTGKSQAVLAAKKIMGPAIKGIAYIPNSTTRAGLEDFMLDNMQSRQKPDGTPIFSNECVGLASELQGILPDQDLGHLTLYNDLYDLPSRHTLRTRMHGEKVLESPYCSILSGAQPAFLATVMPEQAWGMGFTSRNVMIFDVPGKRRSVFADQHYDLPLESALIHDLRLIHNLRGWMTWNQGARALYEEWYVVHGGMPIPTAKRLVMGYNTRRVVHFLKLAMVVSLAQSSDLIVTEQHVADAIGILLEAESNMRHIFNEMAANGATVAIEETIDLVRVRTEEGKGCKESELIMLLSQRFPPQQVQPIITNLLNAGAIVLTTAVNSVGLRTFGTRKLKG